MHRRRTGSGGNDLPARVSERAWLWFLAAGAATTALYFLQTRDLQGITYESVALLAAAAIVVGARLHAVPHPAPWHLVAGGLALFGIGDLVFSAHESLFDSAPFPSLADAFYLAGYPLLAAGLLQLVRHRQPGRDVASLLDALAIAVSVGIPYWVFIVSPLAMEAGVPPLTRAVSIAYPVLDLVLVAVTARLLLGGGPRPFALWLLLVGVATQLVGDTLFSLPSVQEGYVSGDALDALFLVTYVLAGAAGLHPSVAEVTDPAPPTTERVLPAWRVAALGAAVISAPALLAVERGHDHAQHVYGILVGWAILMACLLGRFAGVLRRLSDEATIDPLTRLPKRELLVTRLDGLLAGPSRDLAVLYLDLDRFRTVNENLGHARGDDLLVAVAERLTATVRPGDLVVRSSGEEFAVLCEGIPDEAAARAVADRLTAGLAAPFWLDESPYFLSASIGISRPSSPGDRADLLLRDAAEAMGRAKTGGRARMEVADPNRRHEQSLRVRFERDLYDAVERDELLLHYQPQVDLVGGVVVGVEALLRWHHPHWGTTKPESLLPVADETGLIVPIGRWVVDHACAQLRRWARDEPERAPREVAVNVSQRELLDPGWLEWVQQALRRHDVAPDQLVVEVSDRRLAEAPAGVADVLSRLRGSGVHVCLDELGAGEASLHNLRRFAVDRVKLDRSFATAVADDPGARLVAHSLLQLGESLGLTVIAAGVETRSQRTQLERMGFTLAQGNLWAPPLPPGGVLDSVFGRASG